MRTGIRFAKIGAALFLLVGLGLVAYVPLAMLYNGTHTTKVVASYSETVDQLSNEEKESVLSSAHAYNVRLADASPLPFSSHVDGYENELDISGTQVMGRVTADKVALDLPIYHGTEDSSLMSGAGHLPGSSLPVGGKGSHCVLMGHTGMPDTRLFDGIQELKEGDTFSLQVLDEQLAYQIDSVRTVLPEELDKLKINKEEDRCTLVTCTPYGINSHRLLVSGLRSTETPAVNTEPKVATPQNLSIICLLAAAVVLLAAFVARKRSARNPRHRKNAAEPTVRELAQERSITYAKDGW